MKIVNFLFIISGLTLLACSPIISAKLKISIQQNEKAGKEMDIHSYQIEVERGASLGSGENCKVTVVDDVVTSSEGVRVYFYGGEAEYTTEQIYCDPDMYTIPGFFSDTYAAAGDTTRDNISIHFDPTYHFPSGVTCGHLGADAALQLVRARSTRIRRMIARFLA